MASPLDSEERYASRLSAKADRLVSELLARALENGWRDAEGFLDHFTVESILEALVHDDELRVRLLVETTGTHEKIAAKKSPTSAAEDLRLALDEGTTTPDAVLALFEADDWVRVLQAKPLWEFLTEDKFWNAEPSDPSAFAEAVERVTETVHAGIAHKIISETQVIQAVGFDRLAQRLEETQLREIVVSALEAGAREEPFTVASLLEVLSLEAVIEQATLGRAWAEVVVRLMQEPLGLGPSGVPARRSERPPPLESEPRPKVREREKKNARDAKRPRKGTRPAEEAAAAPINTNVAEAAPRVRDRAPEHRAPEHAAPEHRAADAQPAESGAAQERIPELPRAEPKPLTPPDSARRRTSVPPGRATTSMPPPPRQASSVPPPPPPRTQSLPPPPPSARAAASRQPSGGPVLSTPPPPPNDPGLAQAVTRLGRIDRLPARHGEFPAAVIHAIESMYGELATVSDAQAQLAIIKEAFPNDAWRSRAMLALLELLNPAALATSPEIARESADALSIRLLTEERQLSRQAAQSRNVRPGAR